MRVQLICAIAAMLLLAACDSPEEREAAYLKSGKELYEGGELSKAAIEFRNALKINPTGVEAKYFTALIYEKKGNVPSAISSLRRYLKLAPKAPDHAIIARRLQRLLHPKP
jgi:Tfp pilus assembly protein PilF